MLSDQQFHHAVEDFAGTHGVSYAEAVRAAKVLEEFSTEAEFAETSLMRGQGVTEAGMHAAAKVWEVTHRVPYNVALQNVHDRAQGAPAEARFTEMASCRHMPEEEVLCAAARVFASRYECNFAEALTALVDCAKVGLVPERLEVAFAEGRAVDDASIDAAAKVYAIKHKLPYGMSVKALAETLPISAAAAFSEVAAQAPAAGGFDQAIEIFRAGTHTDASGQPRTFTAQDVMAMAKAYNPAKREAPMVKGHPTTDAPAYGWISRLEATQDGRLMAYGHQVADDFAAELRAGRYKKRSASFYPPGHPNNPTPGTWYLKHLGWLGATQPAVAGLADANFEAVDEGWVSFTL